ncbi:PAS domain-containing protein [Mycolicibacterium mengxianglii]|uniref:PAS domain-containing protein n=1 Tax=Mycolicibacterium mengxianglii TaxID=2736649 RepID=UPI0018D138C8|nr:PAS domain-containing protein [Mycolicibacterium mengxianglii]
MSHEWLLVETLGDAPVVVAAGDQLKNLVPLTVFLRRNPHIDAVTAAVAESAAGVVPLRRRILKADRIIRTVPVVMTDGRVHGVHMWLGPADVAPAPRPTPGPLVWDLTTGVATDTTQSLVNSGMNPQEERTHGRAFAEDLPTRDLNPSETRVLSLAVQNRPGATFCSTWDVTSRDGQLITVGFVARSAMEKAEDGSEHLVARAMNWRSHRPNPVSARDNLAQRILDGLARPGSYRALVDVNTWTLLKWLDEPCPLYDWRGRAGSPWVHPEDTRLIEAMTTQLDAGVTEQVLRLPGRAAEWVPIHVTVHRVELEPGAVAALVTLREPTAAELSARSVDHSPE